MTALTPEILAKIKEYRAAKAREDVLSFAAHMAPHERPASHHHIMARFLMALAAGKIQRLMITMPPRSGKSVYSKYFMAWLLGLRPATKIVHVTHTSALADDVGYETRGLINHENYPWPEISVASDKAARTDWRTSAGGKYYGSSMSAGPTGRPANLLLVDDPITNARDADSETIREHQWNEYTRGLRSRLEPWADGRPPLELMILTRWSEDDLAGRHLPLDYDGRPGRFESRVTGEKWVVCSMPARAEHENDLLGRSRGDWLWPERFGDESPWGDAEKMGGRAWGSLYQQRPAPEAGVIIQRDWIKHYDKRPPLDTLQIYGASDYAVTAAGKESRDPDWTVHMIFGVDPNWHVYLLDMWRGRTTSDVWVEAAIGLMKKWKPLIWGEESGQIRSGVGPFLQRELLNRGIAQARRQYPSREKKGVRAGEFSALESQTLVGMLATGRWLLPKVTPWNPQYGTVDDVVREMLAFPAGRHDDMVDTMSLFARMLGGIIAGQATVSEKAPHPESFENLLAWHDQLNRESAA